MNASAIYLEDLGPADRRALLLLHERPAQDFRGAWRPRGLLDRITHPVLARLAGKSLARVRTTRTERKAMLTAEGRTMAMRLRRE